MKIPVLILTGPTAVGKTDLSIQLAKKLNAEIISADSMQVYKKMDIGSAKITVEEMDGVPHHLIDVVYPDSDFSVSEFKRLSMDAIKDIHSRGKSIIVTGGTGLYLNSLIYDMDFAEVKQNFELRDELNKEYEEHGADHMYQKLLNMQPEVAKNIHPNNVKRVIRALEIALMGGQKGNFSTDLKPSNDIDSKIIVLNRDRDVLYNRINMRVDIMIENGLISEVESLLKDYSRDLTSMQGIGYKEVAEYIYGEVSLDEAVEKIKMGKRRYAKRQITWFKRYKDSLWIDLDNCDTESAIEKIITYI